MFYSVPYDVETSSIKGQNAMHVMAEIVQRCISDWHDSNNATLNSTEKECEPIECENRKEKIESSLEEK